MAMQFSPVLVLGLYGGVLADRYPQRRILLLTQMAMMLLAGLLATVTFLNFVTVEWVYIIALLFGIVTALDNPARQSFVGVMVPPRLLPNAVALSSGNFNLARLSGPAVAGLLIASAGVAWAFLFNALSFLPMLYALATLDSSGFEEVPRTGRGARAFRERPVLRRRASSHLGHHHLGVLHWDVRLQLPHHPHGVCREGVRRRFGPLRHPQLDDGRRGRSSAPSWLPVGRA